MKLVTFNIRLDCTEDGKNNFEYRKPYIQKKLEMEQPDIICFQEVLPHVAQWLHKILPEYTLLGCGRKADLTGEQATVAICSSKFQIVSMETFWLSKTPMVSGSRYPDQSICPRTVTEVILQEFSSKALFHLMNTHLDHEGSMSRQLGMNQILNRFQEKNKWLTQIGKNQPVHSILAGDFNALPDAPELTLMKEKFTDITEGMEGTFHDFGKIEQPEKIDYIAVSDSILCKSRTLWTDCMDGVYLSDHYPIFVELQV